MTRPVGTRTRGRPRATPRRLRHSAAEDLLIKASRLFSRKGFAHTTTREIALAAGVRQPSLFHHYPTKKAMLHALCAATLDEPLRFARVVHHAPGTPATRLYSLLVFYSEHLCSSRYDLRILGICPELLQREFRVWSNKRKQIMMIIGALLAEGIHTGELISVNARFATVALTNLAEGSVDWHPHVGKRQPRAFAHVIAALGLRGLLRQPRRIGAIRRTVLTSDARRAGHHPRLKRARPRGHARAAFRWFLPGRPRRRRSCPSGERQRHWQSRS
jgi:AcrR family transcriptional regulator